MKPRFSILKVEKQQRIKENTGGWLLQILEEGRREGKNGGWVLR
jgi:hypothetical protein